MPPACDSTEPGRNRRATAPVDPTAFAQIHRECSALRSVTWSQPRACTYSDQRGCCFVQCRKGQERQKLGAEGGSRRRQLRKSARSPNQHAPHLLWYSHECRCRRGARCGNPLRSSCSRSNACSPRASPAFALPDTPAKLKHTAQRADGEQHRLVPCVPLSAVLVDVARLFACGLGQGLPVWSAWRRVAFH